jgi:hypothetical protein
MSKSYQIVDPQEPGPSKEAPVKTDWSKCLLCQAVTPEPLQCPAESKRCDVGAGQGYSTLSSNIVRFSELHELPMPIDLARLDEGNGMEATMLEHKAKWHKLCHTKFNITKLQRAEKRKSAMKDCDFDTNTTSKKYIRPKSGSHESATDVCFLCEDIVSASEPCREARTFRLDSRVRKCAFDLQDERLLAKLSAGDMVAQDAKYHPRCLASLYNKAAALQDGGKQDRSDRVSHGIALAELLTYIDEARMDADIAPVFKLADLLRLYSTRLEQLGVEQHIRPHSTELKNRILAQFPDLSAHRDGRNILLAFNKDLGLALRKACDEDYDDEAICLARAAKIVRRDMFELQATFTGSFDQNCQVRSVPHSLLAMVAMILNGPNIKSQSGDGAPQATLSVAQLLQYNSCVRRRAGSTGVHHNKARETPMPMYMGLTVHARTRKRDLVETLFDLGLSISYDRVMEISTAMGNRVCEQYHRDQVVCPPNLRGGLFTTAAIDNIDHNPSSTTATDSFHGTGISLFQHPSPQNDGTDRREHHILEQTSTNKTLSELPQSYTNVHPLGLTRKDPPIPKADGPVKSDGQAIHQALHEEIGLV